MKISPSKIRLDASTICQLRCPGCKTTEGITAQALGSQFLKFNDFKKLVDANLWIRHVELSSQGEIFLNRELLKIVEYAFEKKIILSAAGGTNFNKVSDDMLEGLVKFQFNYITCAIDGASSDTYKIYRQGGDFDKVIANIQKLNALKLKYRSKFPRLCWQFVPFGHNEHEILRAIQMAFKLGMEFSVKLAWGNFSPVKNKKLIQRITGLKGASSKEYQEVSGRSYLTEAVCSQMWVEPQINSDGRVLGCCENRWGNYGNAFQEDFLGILNSERMNYARSMLLGREKENNNIPCVQCPRYHEMKKTNRWVFSEKMDFYAKRIKQAITE